MTYHDGLRATFQQTEAGWRQQYGAPSTVVPIAIIRKPVSDSSTDIETEITNTANTVQASFDLAKGPLWRVVYFELERPAETERRLLIICHHLLIDGISWRILLEDLQLLYTQLSQTGEAQLPFKTLPSRDWVNQLETLDKSSELGYWQAITNESRPPFPMDFPDGTNTMALANTVSVCLPETDTQQLLQQVPAAYNIHIDDLLLTALGLTLTPWAGNTLRIDM